MEKYKRREQSKQKNLDPFKQYSSNIDRKKIQKKKKGDQKEIK